MILFRMDGSGLEDISSVTVTEHFVIVVYEGVYWELEWYGEKEYKSEKLWPHQEYYNRFKKDPNSKPVVDFLIKNNLVTENNYLYLDKMSAKTSFFSLLSSFTENKNTINQLWNSVRDQYAQTSRHYHTLNHIRNLLTILDFFGSKAEDAEVIKFAVFYHDMAYDVSRTDNEEQSAIWAERVMQSLSIESSRIERCKQHIMATKGHSKSEDDDTNLFTDADLSILGAKWEEYYTYCSGVRQEYSIFPDELYKEGRAKVLEKFLEMPAIFKTEPFQKQYEQGARANLVKELEILRKGWLNSTP
jgi:predicted metal-dependent HD superfamily phosphohydrolase